MARAGGQLGQRKRGGAVMDQMEQRAVRRGSAIAAREVCVGWEGGLFPRENVSSDILNSYSRWTPRY